MVPELYQAMNVNMAKKDFTKNTLIQSLINIHSSNLILHFLNRQPHCVKGKSLHLFNWLRNNPSKSVIVGSVWVGRVVFISHITVDRSSRLWLAPLCSTSLALKVVKIFRKKVVCNICNKNDAYNSSKPTCFISFASLISTFLTSYI